MPRSPLSRRLTPSAQTFIRDLERAVMAYNPGTLNKGARVRIDEASPTAPKREGVIVGEHPTYAGYYIVALDDSTRYVTIRWVDLDPLDLVRAG